MCSLDSIRLCASAASVSWKVESMGTRTAPLSKRGHTSACSPRAMPALISLDRARSVEPPIVRRLRITCHHRTEHSTVAQSQGIVSLLFEALGVIGFIWLYLWSASRCMGTEVCHADTMNTHHTHARVRIHSQQLPVRLPQRTQQHARPTEHTTAHTTMHTTRTRVSVWVTRTRTRCLVI